MVLSSAWLRRQPKAPTYGRAYILKACYCLTATGLLCMSALSFADQDSIMLQIFAALCEVQDFAVCEGVCRAWRRLLPDCQPSTDVASRQQPLQQLLWLAAHRKLMHNIDEFVIRDDITDAAADIELLNLLDLAFKRARGLTYLSLEVQVRDSSCLVVSLQSSQGRCT